MDKTTILKNIMTYATSIYEINAKLRRMESENNRDSLVYKACLLKYKMLSDEETAYYSNFLKDINDVERLKNFFEELSDKIEPVVAIKNELVTKRLILEHVMKKCTMIFDTNYLKLHPLESKRDFSKDQMRCADNLLYDACLADIFNYSRVSVYEYAREMQDKELENWVIDEKYYFLYKDAISSLYNFGFSHDLTGNYLVSEAYIKKFNIPYINYLVTITGIIAKMIDDYAKLIYLIPSNTTSFKHLIIQIDSTINLWPDDDELIKNNIPIEMSKKEMIDIFYGNLYEILKDDKIAIKVLEDVWDRKKIKMRKLK